MAKLKYLYNELESKLRMCFDSILNRLYPTKEKLEYRRNKYSLKYFPLENVGMCLDEYMYRFERVDDNEDFLMKD